MAPRTNPKYGIGFEATEKTLARRIVKSGKVQLRSNPSGYDRRVAERAAIRAHALKVLSK